MEEIVEQGEGMDHGSIWDGDKSMFHHDRHEVSHYFRFKELLEGRYYKVGDTPQSGPTGRKCDVDWDAVYNIRENVRNADFPHGGAIHTKLGRFQPKLLRSAPHHAPGLQRRPEADVGGGGRDVRD